MESQVERQLAAGFRSGIARFGELGLARDVFDARVRAVFDARVRATAAHGGPASSDDLALAGAIARLELADLYLALAWDEQHAAAIRAYEARCAPRVAANLIRAGIARARAADAVDELPGVLASPPPQGSARTRMGTYAGSASLVAWVTVIALRSCLDELRRAGRRSSAERLAPPLSALVAREPDPSETVAGGEAGERLDAALRDAFPKLTAREQLVLLYRYRDGLKQREIVALFDVSESRVSRLHDQAIEKLRRSIGALSRDAGTPRLGEHDGVWERLRESVGLTLRRLRSPRVSREERAGEP